MYFQDFVFANIIIVVYTIYIMSYQSIYRKFRPDTFDKVIGQEHIVRTLTNQIKSGRVSHAYLFTGTRGTGKTTCAKIFAKAVNCLSPINGSPCGKCASCKSLELTSNTDVVELDAASNNGVDEIRILRDNAQYPPTNTRYKVYIIDEVHMLTINASNALLKILEEPPEYVIFLLATTDPQKLPMTILSRCMRFDFRLVSVNNLTNLLKDIFTQLNIGYDIQALNLMSIHGEGSVRDTLSIAEMCMSYGGDTVTMQDTLDILTVSSFDSLHKLGSAILSSDVATALKICDELISSGRTTLNADLTNYFMDLLSVKNTPNLITEKISNEEQNLLLELANNHSNYKIARIMDILSSLESAMRYSTQPRILLEASIVKCCELITEVNIDGLVNRIKELELSLSDIKKNGVFAPQVAVSQVAEETIDTPIAPPKTDFQKLLDEKKIVAMRPEEDEEDSVDFQEEEITDETSAKANEYYNIIISKLSEQNHSLLSLALQSCSCNCSLTENEFLLKTKDKGTQDLMLESKNLEIMDNIVKSIISPNYKFLFVPLTEEEEKLNHETRLTLNQLFNKTIKYKR